MAGVHCWGLQSRTRTTDKVRPETNYYLELRATDDEIDVQVWWEGCVTTPDFVVAPHVFDSRTNSVIAANIRRMLPKDTLVAVMIHGRKRRERQDMIHWLIENEYLPMFPRFMPNEASPSVPLNRLQLIHESRAIIDREPDQLFVCHTWKGTGTVVLDYIRSTEAVWELLG